MCGKGKCGRTALCKEQDWGEDQKRYVRYVDAKDDGRRSCAHSKKRVCGEFWEQGASIGNVSRMEDGRWKMVASLIVG